METVARLVSRAGLLGLSQELFQKARESTEAVLAADGTTIYRGSLHVRDSILYLIASTEGKKALFGVSSTPFTSAFEGSKAQVGGIHVMRAELTYENALRLHELFPFTAPVSLRNRTTTIGCGDRLGMATPGHIRAVSAYQASPVLAQQSMRELTLTGRDYPGVVKDVTFLVFQEGYERGYGADGDHLKNVMEIDAALDAKMPMITLDLTDVLSLAPATWSDSKVNEEFSRLAPEAKRHVAEAYADRTFAPSGLEMRFTRTEAERCALMYSRALEYSRMVSDHLKKRRGNQFDLEISIDEMAHATPVTHHLFLASELARHGVVVSSLAPRFVGEFQKGIDYIGDLEDFESQFRLHCAIAREYGNYKVSIHSGSDKFAVYPAIGRHTRMRLHVKTSGTSWLEGLRVIARADPQLFRGIFARALGHFPDASKNYHVTPHLAAIPDIRRIPDSQLEAFLNADDSRQVLHITYGGLFHEAQMRQEILSTLVANEESHYAAVEENLRKHLSKLGVPLRPD